MGASLPVAKRRWAGEILQHHRTSPLNSVSPHDCLEETVLSQDSPHLPLHVECVGGVWCVWWAGLTRYTAVSTFKGRHTQTHEPIHQIQAGPIIEAKHCWTVVIDGNTHTHTSSQRDIGCRVNCVVKTTRIVPVIVARHQLLHSQHTECPPTRQCCVPYPDLVIQRCGECEWAAIPEPANERGWTSSSMALKIKCVPLNYWSLGGRPDLNTGGNCVHGGVCVV